MFKSTFSLFSVTKKRCHRFVHILLALISLEGYHLSIASLWTKIFHPASRTSSVSAKRKRFVWGMIARSSQYGHSSRTHRHTQKHADAQHTHSHEQHPEEERALAPPTTTTDTHQQNKKQMFARRNVVRLTKHVVRLTIHLTDLCLV